MACGSGSFLLGAYQALLDHYLHWYSENSPEKHAKEVYSPVPHPTTRRIPRWPVEPTVWRLTSAERKRILIEHIYGVDIDRQAVEVTKLSLLLKVLEGETDETLGKQMRLLPRPGAARSGPQHPVRQQPDRPGLLRRAPRSPTPTKLKRVNVVRLEGCFPRGHGGWGI